MIATPKVALSSRGKKFEASQCASHTMSKLLSMVLTFALLFGMSASLASPVFGQSTGHNAVLSWSAPSDSTTGTVYNVYRANAVCPVSGVGTLTFTQINTTPVTALTYTDNTIGIGNWCYYVTQVTSSVESAPGNTGGGVAKPKTVTFTVVIN